jgi:hypothetical protein
MSRSSSNNNKNTTEAMVDDFDKRHLEEIDLQFKHIEAIKYYDAVKKERDEVKNERDGLEGKFAEASNTIRWYKDNTLRLEQQVQKLKEEVEKAARDNHQLRSRVEELERLKITVFGENRPSDMDAGSSSSGDREENVTTEEAPPQPRAVNLAKVQRLFLKAKEEEINRRAEEHFNSIKQKWQRNEKPKLVSDAAAQSLRTVVEHIVSQGMQATTGKPLLLPPSSSSPASSSPDQPPPSLPPVPEELYSKVRSILESGVKKKLDFEFERRVEAEAQNRAEEKLEYLSVVEWPNFYNQTILPLANELEQRIDNNVFNFLTGPWNIICKICGATHQSRMLSPEEVESLISNRTLELQCYRTYLRSQINWVDNIFGIAHSFKIALIELVQGKLSPREEEER